MEKLIELLNRGAKNDDWCLVKIEGNVRKFDERLIISKSYGFIKWLVDNDKIDIYKLKFKSDFTFPIWKNFDQLGSEDIEEYSKYESILMLIAIQDEPIKFLISILK